MTSDPAMQLPAWFDEYVTTFSAGAAHGFILSGDIAGATVQGLSQRRFLQTVLGTRRAVVAQYDRAQGISFPLASMRQKALDLLGTTPASAPTDPMAAAIAASGLGMQPTGDVFAAARRPLEALTLLGQLLRAPEGRGNVAVILDYAETLCPAMDKALMSADDRLVLVTLLSWGQDGDLARCDNPVFLLAGRAGELHDDLRSSGSGYKLIEIPLPSREERATYLSWYLRQREEQGRTIPLQDVRVQELANLTAGLNIRHLEDVLLLSAKSGGVSRRLVKARKDSIIAAEYSNVAEMIDPLPGGFGAIGGMERLVAWARSELITPLSQGQRDVPKGVLLVGPPGTGKTYYVRALAAEVGFNAVALRAENILGGIVGESERKLKSFFAFARSLAPVLVFFDELDQGDMSQRGNTSGSPVAANLFNQMLQFMSDESLRGEVLVFFASNRPDLIDPALLRFGRMDAIIPVLLPDEEARKGIVRAQAQGQAMSITEEAVSGIAGRTTNYSAADLAAVVFKARKLAQRLGHAAIQVADAEQALRYIRPATPQLAERYTLLAIAACNDAELLPPPYDSLLGNREALQAKLSASQASPAVRDERTW